MSIYQPNIVSGLTQSASGLLGSAVKGISQSLGGKLTNQLGGPLGSLAAGAVDYGTNLALSQIGRKINHMGLRADQSLEGLLSTTANALGLSAYHNDQVDNHSLLFAGGLSLKEMRQIIDNADGKNLSRKHFFVLEINDGVNGSPVSGGYLSRFNLFTQALDLNPIEISSDAVQIGSAAFHSVTQSGLTEMTLTVLDDRLGSIKRWAKFKQAVTVPSDGSVLPPIYRVFDVRVIYGTNKAYDEFYQERYTMQLAASQVQLTRTEQGLEEITLRFVQESTFMPPRY